MADKSKAQISKEQKNRDRVPYDVEKFLAGGGKIEQIDLGVTGQKNNYGKQYPINIKSKRSKESK